MENDEITLDPPPSGSGVKRRAPSCDIDEASHKRFKEDHAPEDGASEQASITSLDACLSEALAEELQCGCCSELVYRPVVVSPCQHFFCGRQVFSFTNRLRQLIIS
jgi:E3 ubiquitin-protein ligase CHFR